MAATRHPIRDLPIDVFVGAFESIALIGDGKRYSFPYFRAPTAEAARAKAEAFRDRVLAEHEESFVKRQETAAKAAAKRSAKEAA